MLGRTWRFAVGEVLTFNGLLRPLRDALTEFEVLAPGGAPATLPNLLGVSPWYLVIPLTLLGTWWTVCAFRKEDRLRRIGGWLWPVPGILLGVLGIAAWWISQGTGWDYGIGVVGATGPILRAIWEGTTVLTWGSFLVLAMPVGGFLAAWSRGEFLWKPPGFRDSMRFLLSGLAMGISAAIAGGCNIGHTFTGAPTLALSSLLASGADKFSASLSLARTKAIMSRRNVRLCPSTNGTTCTVGTSADWTGGWIMFVDNDGNGLPASSELVQAHGALDSRISLTTPSAFTQFIQFRPTGIVLGNGGVTGQFNFCSGDFHDYSRLVNIGASGRVTTNLPKA